MTAAVVSWVWVSKLTRFYVQKMDLVTNQPCFEIFCHCVKRGKCTFAQFSPTGKCSLVSWHFNVSWKVWCFLNFFKMFLEHFTVPGHFLFFLPHSFSAMLLISAPPFIEVKGLNAILHCHWTLLHWPARTIHRIALHGTARHCTALHCTAQHCTALHCTTLHCTALHCYSSDWQKKVTV